MPSTTHRADCSASAPEDIGFALRGVLKSLGPNARKEQLCITVDLDWLPNEEVPETVLIGEVEYDGFHKTFTAHLFDYRAGVASYSCEEVG